MLFAWSLLYLLCLSIMRFSQITPEMLFSRHVWQYASALFRDGFRKNPFLNFRLSSVKGRR